MNLKNKIFLILFILSFIISVVKNYDKINVPYFGGLYKGVFIDVIYNKNDDLKLVEIDNNFLNTLKIEENHYLYKTKSYKRVNGINIINPEKIKQIVVYVDKTAQFDNFDRIDNSKNFLSKITIIILSFFYDFYLYLFSYLFLFLFLYNFKGRINLKVCFWVCFILIVLFRLTQINSIPFWDDEIYVLKASANYSPLKDLFSDPGNPPLYFILFKIYRLIFYNPHLYRFSSAITGIVFCVVFYLYIKKMLNKQLALISLFFAGFSISLIYFSQEIRCYMLLMLISILTSYFLFKHNKKGYLITSICLLYTHFYGVFYYLFNFGFSIYYFKKKRKKDFIFLNIIAGLSFAPCAIYKLVTLNDSFNSWIKVPNITDYLHAVKVFCGHSLIFLLFIILLIYIYKTSAKRKKLFVLYNSIAIIFVVIFAIAFSYFVKPVFMYRYFYIVYPCYVALCTVLVRDIRQSIIVFLLFISQGILGYQNLYCNHNLYLDFINHKIDKSKINYVFMSDTVQGYKEFLNDNIKPIYVQINTGLNTINPSDYNIKKPSDCWVLNLYLDEKVYSEAKNIELYKTPLGVFVHIKY